MKHFKKLAALSLVFTIGFYTAVLYTVYLILEKAALI